MRLGSMTRTGWICVVAVEWSESDVAGGGGEVSADVIDGGDGFFEGLLGGGVDGGNFLLDVETISGKAAGDIEELTGDDVTDSADEDKGDDAGDCDGDDARDAPGLKAADGRGQ